MLTQEELMLATVDMLRSVPGVRNLVTAPEAYVNLLIVAADKAFKNHCKQNIELLHYRELVSGEWQQDVVLKQYPVWCAKTRTAAPTPLPAATIPVVDAADFPPVNAGQGRLPSVAVQVGTNSWVTVTYSGKTSTTLTGCSGGSGTANGSVSTPVVYVDSTAAYGARDNAFADACIQPYGTSWAPVVDVSDANQSESGRLRRVGGTFAVGFADIMNEVYGRGKLGAYRAPNWPRGSGNILVKYSAGYYPVPEDAAAAVLMLAAYGAHNLPYGSPVSSESLGAFNYSVLNQQTDVPELLTVQATARYYRELMA